jgi:leader peptidase (prepilin peptidase) / N-methyltransferase
MLLSVIVVIIIGLAAGALVNALADDLPQHRSPRLPHYPDDTPRPPIAWSGILAFLTGKRSSPGGAKLSWRYPLAEILTTGAMLLAVYRADNDPHITAIQVIFWLIYMAIFALVIVIDVEHRLILFSVMIPSALLAIVDALVAGYGADVKDALLGGALGFGLFFLMYLGGFAFTWMVAKLRGQKLNEVAFGYGDVMLATVSGLILGWRPLIFALYIGVILGGLGAMVYLIGRKLAGHKSVRYAAIPYGPYIVIGTTIVMLFSPVLFTAPAR